MHFTSRKCNCSFHVSRKSQRSEHIRTSEDHEKCGALMECEDKKILISLYSGKQSVTSPYICINGRVIMSRETNGAGRGLNVIILEPLTGIVLRRLNFDTFLEKDDTALDLILSQLTTEQLVIVLTHDDASHGLSSAIKKTFQSLGSSMIDKLNFRGSWFFIGQKGIKGFSPFEDVCSQMCPNIHSNFCFQLHRSAEEMKWAPPVSAKMCVPYKRKRK
ncbi:hypothetical protein TTRE_0000255801 [Trichuris trichiura]|uniref:ILEI/PANDER domain-containing protein n=1 Tax=Trichuris trichiura TaxID=36087 RepID=A0A077Z3P5_TRITR|nr:hypothetical protein TTRE_0000255801 [Trichuris trichiura]